MMTSCTMPAVHQPPHITHHQHRNGRIAIAFAIAATLLLFATLPGTMIPFMQALGEARAAHDIAPEDQFD